MKKLFLSPPWLGGMERERVSEAFDSGYIAPCGPLVERFERDFCRATNLPHACALASGTAALDLLFHELHIKPGDLVLCSDLTFVASIAPAIRRGAMPVFIDSDTTTWTIDPNLLAQALADAAAAGQPPKAVVAVDLYGQCCDYARIETLCAQYGVPLIIDAAEALGAEFHGAPGSGTRRAAGDAGWAAIYSFNGNKIITASGGGMLASRDGDMVERARQRAQQAREPAAWYEHVELGYNYRLSNIMAAVGVGQLELLEEIIERKRRIFGWYQESLDGIKGIDFMPEAPYGRCTRWLTVITLPDYDGQEGASGERAGSPGETILRLVAALAATGIEARPMWKPMHLQPVFREARLYGGKVGARLFRQGLCLPSGAGMERSDVERVAAEIHRTLQA